MTTRASQLNQGAFLTASRLAAHASRIVSQDLEGFGNYLNDEHRLALRQTIETYSAMGLWRTQRPLCTGPAHGLRQDPIPDCLVSSRP
jgi:hypothetical protein